MSEEKIIKECKTMISTLKDIEMFYTYEQLDYENKYKKQRQYQAIQGLLDLYMQEKEKNKDLLELLNKSGLNQLSLVNDVNENYISKDKIREKIKELNSKEFYQNFPEDYMAEISINILKELINE